MTTTELQKIYNYTIKKGLQVNDSVFPSRTLRKFEIAIQEKNSKKIALTEAQKNLLVKTFLQNPTAFDESTPNIIIEDPTCLLAAINIDLNSLAFLSYFYEVPREIFPSIIAVAKKKKYTLTPISPSFLKHNFNIAFNSIHIDCQTADYVDYDYIWYKDKQTIISVLSKSRYVISEKTPEYLLNSETICLTSLKNDLKSLEFLPIELKAKPTIFKYLLHNGYEFSDEELEQLPISILSDEEVLTYYQEKLLDNLYKRDHDQLKEILKLFKNIVLSEVAKENFKKLIRTFTSTKPTIESFEQIWTKRALEEWHKYRSNHPTDYANLFVKITGELRNVAHFEEVFKNISFFDIRLTIPKSYDNFVSAMKEYFNIYHSEDPDYLEHLQKPAAAISKYIALYIAASKEAIVKEELHFFKWWSKPYFKIKQDNPSIKKKIIEHRCRKLYEYLYLNSDPTVENFVDSLIQKYKDSIPENHLKVVITAIIRGFKHIDFLVDAPKKPRSYDAYKHHHEVKRIVNRLNSGYIKYDNPEVQKEIDFICWDKNKEQYFVAPINISPSEVADIEKYEEFLKVYKDLNAAILAEIKKVKYDGFVEKEIIETLTEQLPFTDEFFEFDETKLILKNLLIPIQNFHMHSDYSYSFIYENSGIFYLLNSNFYSETILSDSTYYQIVYKLLVESSIAWLLCIEQNNIENIPKLYKEKCLDPQELLELLNNIPELLKFAKMFNYSLESFNDFVQFNNISTYMDAKSLAILGPEIALNLHKDNQYSKEAMGNIIKKACYLISNMCKRNSSTVPYVAGNTQNYTYSTYDSGDNELLLAGIKTNSCFKINNTDNDFLFYTALDKNGFVIKITDNVGNFIARASGFRNGNFIYINQLRTVYDKGNNEIAGISPSESNELISALKKACEDMIRISKSNPYDELGIDAVFITRSYLLKNYQGPIISTEKIGEQPIDHTSKDWQEFIQNNGSYLQESPRLDYFTTDFSSYPLLCLASSTPLNKDDLNMPTIKRKDTPALYHRHRNSIMYGTFENKEILMKVNKIAGVYAYLNDLEFISPQVQADNTIFVGDNWYAITDNGKIVESCVLNQDPEAIKELTATIETMKNTLQLQKTCSKPKPSSEIKEKDTNLSASTKKLIKK